MQGRKEEWGDMHERINDYAGDSDIRGRYNIGTRWQNKD